MSLKNENIDHTLKSLEQKVQDLEKSLELYKSIVANLPVGIQVFDKDGFSFMLNKKQQELLGIPDLSTGIGKFNVLTDPYAKASGASNIYQKVYKGSKYEHVYKYNLGIEENKWNTRKDTRIFNESIFPVINKDGKVEYTVAILDDQTEKKTAEIELAESEKHHKDFVNHSPDILYKFSSKKGATFWSKSVEDILGYKPEELKKDPLLWNNSIHPDDKERVKEAINNFEKGHDYSIDYRIKTKNGDWIWLHDYFMFKTKLEDEIIIEGHATDITKQKALEIELEDVKERFELAMHATEDGIWDWNLITNEIYFSPNWKKMLGYNEKELPDKFSIWEELTHPDDVKEAWKILNEHIEGKRKRFDIEFRMKHKNGHWVNILSRANAFFDKTGKAYRVVGTHVDITDRIKAQEIIKESQIKFKTIFDILDVGLTITDSEGNIIDCNSASEKILGITKQEHLERNYADKQWNIIRMDNTPMPTEEFASVRAMKENKTIRDVKMGIVKSSGTTWISVNATPIDLDGYGVLVAYVDITPLVEKEQLLTNLNKTKDKLFSIISHDLKSPFNALIGLNKIALEKIESNEIKTAEIYLKTIQDTAKNTLNLLENLLQWSRLQTGRFEFNPEKISINEIVNKITSLLKIGFNEKNISIKTEIDPYLIVTADKNMLETIFRNLLSNSIKFTQNGGNIIISAQKINNQIECFIQDDGIGIEEKDIEKIFDAEAYYTTAGTNNEKGTGLGLILCKEFVEMHNGRIWVESKREQGSKFIFTLNQ